VFDCFPATHIGGPVKPTAVRCRMSNACFRRSIFTPNGPAGSRFFLGFCALAGFRNFLLLLGYVLHFATYGFLSDWPLCTVERAVRGGSQRRRCAGSMQRVERGVAGHRMGWIGQSGSRVLLCDARSAVSFEHSAVSRDAMENDFAFVGGCCTEAAYDRKSGSLEAGCRKLLLHVRLGRGRDSPGILPHRLAQIQGRSVGGYTGAPPDGWDVIGSRRRISAIASQIEDGT
jgi:hypothetical protein